MVEKTSNGYRSVIIGTGAGVPQKVLTNADLEKIVDTSDEWIVQRTGIRERRIAAEGETNITFSLEASLQALERAGIAAEDLDMIIVGTQTPDMILPSAACLLQDRLNIPGAPALDVVAGCTGFLYGLVVADRFIRADPSLKILVVGSEIVTSLVDWTDRSTCVIFGDGAGAVVVTGENNGSGILASSLMADGTKWELLRVVGGGSAHPPSHEMVDQGLHFLRMEGNKVFKFAVPAMVQAAEKVLAEAGLRADDVALVIPHQANIRIIEAVANRLKVPMDRVVQTIQKYGNTSTATIPVALAEADREGRLKRGDVVLMVSFGGGFTWGAAALRW